MRHAGIAMYSAKEAGRNTYRFYAPGMNDHAYEFLVAENELRRAIECDEFVVHYQPQVSLETGAITGVEALVRW
jgi:predicted signal transduction protein with EAL and GGDEF domain